MTINNWPENERPREKLLHQGASALSDAELLAIFFRTGMKDKSAVDLGRELLQKFGDLRTLLDADIKDFCQTKGVGIVKHLQLQAALELNRRYLFTELQQADCLKNPEKTKQYFISKLGHKTSEVFAVLLLDSKFKVIKFLELFHGNLNRTDIYPGELAKIALKYNAFGLILAHNHPSGDPTPSQSDLLATQELRSALALIDVRLFDHIIVAKNQALSFVSQGLL